MCIVLLASHADPRWPLVLAANRDEFFARPTAAADFWKDAPSVLGGRDLQSGGSWLGITRGGRIALVTNFREPGPPDPTASSRGHLVGDFLRGDADVDAWITALEIEAHRYNGFSTIFGDREQLGFFSNRGAMRRSVEHGYHGLSNHLLDTPWLKLRTGIEGLQRIVEDEPRVEPLMDLLADRTPDASLSGLEGILSPIFIATPTYGTRSSTVIVVDAEGRTTFVERRFGPGGVPQGESRFDL